MLDTVPDSHLSALPGTSIQSFGELSEFLRSAVADEESLQLGESLSVLATHIEGIVTCLRQDPESGTLAGMLMDLLTALRQQRAMVVELNPAWRGLHEYAAYLGALNHFRVLIAHWMTGDGTAQERSLNAEDFDLLGWRLLGGGALLIDVYQRTGGLDIESELEAPDPSLVARARSWWDKLGQ